MPAPAESPCPRPLATGTRRDPAWPRVFERQIAQLPCHVERGPPAPGPHPRRPVRPVIARAALRRPGPSKIPAGSAFGDPVDSPRNHRHQPSPSSPFFGPATLTEAGKPDPGPASERDAPLRGHAAGPDLGQGRREPTLIRPAVATTAREVTAPAPSGLPSTPRAADAGLPSRTRPAPPSRSGSASRRTISAATACRACRRMGLRRLDACECRASPPGREQGARSVGQRPFGHPEIQQIRDPSHRGRALSMHFYRAGFAGSRHPLGTMFCGGSPRSHPLDGSSRGRAGNGSREPRP